MRNLKIILLSCLLGITTIAWAITGEDVLDKIDSNMVIENAVSISTMTIHSRMGTRNIQAKSWVGEKIKPLWNIFHLLGKKVKKCSEQGTNSGSTLPNQMRGSSRSPDTFCDNR